MTSQNQSSMGVLKVAIVLTLGLGLAGWGRHQLSARPQLKQQVLQEVLMLPPGKVIRQWDLGYHSVMADLLFIRANLYYGQHILTDEQMPWMAHFIGILLDLDPHFKKAYLWGAMVTLYFKRVIDTLPDELIVKANRILARGMKQFPNDHRFPMRIAFNHYYERGDIEGALPYFAQAARVPGAPDWIRKKVVDLYSKQGRRDLSTQMLKELVAEADNPAMLKSLQDRLKFNLSDDDRKAILWVQERLFKEWETKYEFIPFDLFLLIREP